jgi:diacylglycerol kinase (ATP)
MAARPGVAGNQTVARGLSGSVEGFGPVAPTAEPGYNAAMLHAGRPAATPARESAEGFFAGEAAPSKILVLVNPASGGGRGGRLRSRVARYFQRCGRSAEFVSSPNGEDLELRAREAQAAGYRRVVVLGGDGALLRVVNGLSGSEVELGIIPAGHANDVAASLGVPRHPRAAAETVLEGRVRPVDLVRVRFAGGRAAFYVGVGGAGLDAEAARLANTRFRRLPGVTRYLAGALWAFKTFEPLRFEAELDGVRVSGALLLAVVANAPAYGAGIRIAPAAEMDDGWLDVTLVEPLSLMQFVRAIPILLRSGDIRWPEVRRYRCRVIRLAADRPAGFHGDGEMLGALPVELEVLPRALRVLVPRTR